MTTNGRYAVTSRHEDLPSDLLLVDHSYQRPEIKQWVRELARDWNPLLCRELVVSRRASGLHYLIDGQQRVAAQKLRGADSELMPCQVYEGLTVTQEAVMFAKQNKGVTLRPNWEFRARLEGGDADAIAIDQAIRDAGFGLNLLSHDVTERRLVCIGAIETCWRLSQEDFKTTLRVLFQSLPDDDEMRKTGQFRGLNGFIRHYRGQFDEKSLIEKLSRSSGIAIASRASAFKPALSGSNAAAKGVALAILEIYNSKRRVSRLPAYDITGSVE